jgi:GntR family transcriptional regulator
MYEEACLAASQLPGLDGADAGNYAVSALAQRHGLHLANATERVSLVEASPEVAVQLGVAPQTPLLRLDRVVFAMDGRPVEWWVGLCHLPEDIAYLGDMQ